MNYMKSLILTGKHSTTWPSVVEHTDKIKLDLIYDIPVALWLEYFALAQRIAPFTISVGSGLGAIEAYLQANLWPIPIFVPVDPAPLSYDTSSTTSTHQIIMPPMFNVIDELIQLNPRLIGHVNVALIWPTPMVDPASSYDMEAVTKLRPRAIFTLVGIDGSAGSRTFLGWLKTQTDYVVIRRCESVSIKKSTLFYYPDEVRAVLMVLVRKDCFYASIPPEFSQYYSRDDFALARRHFDEEAELTKLTPAQRRDIGSKKAIVMMYLLGKMINRAGGR